jgi:hypothetical protein
LREIHEVLDSGIRFQDVIRFFNFDNVEFAIGFKRRKKHRAACSDPFRGEIGLPQNPACRVGQCRECGVESFPGMKRIKIDDHSRVGIHRAMMHATCNKKAA